MARTFGVTTTSAATGGIIANSISTATSVEVAEARDQQGKVTDRKAYSKTTSVDIQGVLDGTIADAGTLVTVGTDSFLVTNATKSETNTGYQEGSFTATKVDASTDVAYSAGSGN